MRRAALVAVCSVLGVYPAVASGQEVIELVRDLNTWAVDGSSRPFTAVRAGDLVYYAATDGLHGTELWRSDGTTAGTWVVTSAERHDLDPAEGYFHPAVGSGLLFWAWDEENGMELRWTDGSRTSAQLVRDIVPGPDGSGPGSFASVGLAAGADPRYLFFTANDGVHGSELWRTDLTAAGTTMVADVCPGACSSSPGMILPVGERVIFAAAEVAWSTRKMWLSDGTPQGTERLLELTAQDDWQLPGDAVRNGAGVLFSACRLSVGCELWRSDGTVAGTKLVADLNPDTGSYPRSIVPIAAQTWLFVAETNGSGEEVFVTNGLAASLVKDLFPGAIGSEPGYLVGAEGRAYFSAIVPGSASRRLMVSNGTAAGTHAFTTAAGDLFVASAGDSVAVGSSLVIRATDPALGTEPHWVTDSDTPPTVIDLCPGACSSNPTDIGAVGGRAVVVASVPSFGRGVWGVTEDGTSTLLVGPLAASGDSWLESAAVSWIAMTLDDGVHGLEPWRSDGTPEGTRMVQNIALGSYDSNPTELVAGSGFAVLSAADGPQGPGLWLTDGSRQGTILVAPRLPLQEGVVAANGRAIFAAGRPNGGHELWSSDGTVRGTLRVVDWRMEEDSPYLKDFVAVGDGAAFAVEGAGDIRGIWMTDGRREEAFRLVAWPQDAALPHLAPCGAGLCLFRSENGSSQCRLWVVDQVEAPAEPLLLEVEVSPCWMASGVLVGEVLYFRGVTAAAGHELWRTDGTEAGTWLVADVFPLDGGSEPEELVAVGDRLFFTAEHYVYGRELWTSDGSESGTHLVLDIIPGTESGSVEQVQRFGDGVVFTARCPDRTGWCLWRSDGSAVGTTVVADDVSFRGDAASGSLEVGGSKVYFAARHERLGDELWAWDAATGELAMVGDLCAAERGSTPRELTWTGDELLFVADDRVHGRELFRVTQAAAPRQPGGRH